MTLVLKAEKAYTVVGYVRTTGQTRRVSQIVRIGPYQKHRPSTLVLLPQRRYPWVVMRSTTHIIIRLPDSSQTAQFLVYPNLSVAKSNSITGIVVGSLHVLQAMIILFGALDSPEFTALPRVTVPIIRSKPSKGVSR
jgi:hypothetical protein